MQISTYIKHGDFISAHKSLYLSSCSLPRGIYVEQISEVPEDRVACWWCKQGDTGNAFKKGAASEGTHEQEISQSNECSQIDNWGVTSGSYDFYSFLLRLSNYSRFSYPESYCDLTFFLCLFCQINATRLVK